MLQPDQFAVNEAWIAFRLNEEPIFVEDQGSFSVVALMDAASCFIMGSGAYQDNGTNELPMPDCIKLLKEAFAYKKDLAKTMYVPDSLQANSLKSLAEQQGMQIVCVPESQLLAFTSEARESFKDWAK